MRTRQWRQACAAAAGMLLTATAMLTAQNGARTQPPANRTSPPAAASAEYVIGPEDVLDIVVWKNPDLTRTVPVRPDGKISVPLLNDLQAAGLTAMQLKNVLVKGLSADGMVVNPEVSVIVKEVNSTKVSVMGKVKKPGRYVIKSQTTILDALAMAEGFADFAKPDRIIVMRKDAAGNEKKIPFDYKELVSDDGRQPNFFLLPGDIIVVP